MSPNGKVELLRRRLQDLRLCLPPLCLSLFFVLAPSGPLPLQASAAEAKSVGKKEAHADYERLAGRWLRPDGGYVLEIGDPKADGRLKISYFNPKPIKVSKGEWRRMGNRVQVFAELQDIGYPGCTYTLVYYPERDQLEGYYHQAAIGQTFDVLFVRTK